MASTYSSNLKIELIATGEQTGTWGVTTNNNFSNVFEQAIVGRGNPNFASDADLTITLTSSVSSQTARNLYLNVTSSVGGGLTQTRNLIVPTIYKNYVIENNTTGGQSIIVKTAAGSGVTVPNGKKAAVYVNGTDVIPAFDYLYAPSMTGFTSSADGTFTGTGQVKLPAGTTGERSGSPANGMIRYNTTTGQFEGYQAGQWGTLGGGATGGGGDEVFVENGVTVTTNYTLTTNKNAESVGPITINPGIVVTVPPGQRWVVL